MHEYFRVNPDLILDIVGGCNLRARRDLRNDGRDHVKTGARRYPMWLIELDRAPRW